MAIQIRNDIDSGKTAALSASPYWEQSGGTSALPDLSDQATTARSNSAPNLFSIDELAALSPSSQVPRHLLQEIEIDLFNVLSSGIQFSPKQEWFRDRVLDAVSIEPVEDGYSHPAEGILEHAIDSDAEAAARWIRSLIVDPNRPAIAAATLKCLGRLNSPVTAEWRADLISKALASSDVEVRDAAAQAVELWEDGHALEVLRQHVETEPWLRAYIEKVLHDLIE